MRSVFALKSLFLSNNFYPNLTKDLTKMQPSIRQFFKTKEPPSKAVEKREEQNSIDKEKSAIAKENQGEIIATPKRPAEDNMGDYSKSETPSKRRAVESDTNKLNEDKPVATPVKVQDGKISPDNTVSADKQRVNASFNTPTKPNLLDTKKLSLPASPLMDVQVLIRKKISSGAFALHENIGVSWFRALLPEFDKPYFKKLSAFVQSERSSKLIFPPANKVYSWTHHHDIKNTRVVILGQDPYHGTNQAHGLSFSVQKGVRIPPSLVNIFKEIENDIPGFKAPTCGDLTGWAKQGVLMLNTCLTVEQGKANSHQNKGWETFTDAVISWLSKNSAHKLVFLLWGRPAQRKASMIDKRHKVLTSSHPSPLSAHTGFFGSSHFSQTNAFLKSQGLTEIDWKAL